MIDGKNESFACRIPEGNRKHAVQPGHEIGTVLFIQMGDDFAIASGVQFMPFVCQHLSKGRGIVYFTVIDDYNGPVFIIKRL
ncbi:hypothetical protein PbJCM17693_58690 [Paenibacillus macerans]|nr:hypothetical protein PbJCM17693_58690 [Paenibacillus macerans]